MSVLGVACEAAGSAFPCEPSSGVSCAHAAGVALMLGGRVLAGCASGATTVVVPIYLGEISPPHLRGALGVMFQLACVAALLTAQVLGLPALLGSRALWPLYLLGGVAIPSAVQLLLRQELPESPHWLAGRSAAEGLEAERVLCSLRGVDLDAYGPLRDAVTKELDYMQLAAVGRGGGDYGADPFGAEFGSGGGGGGRGGGSGGGRGGPFALLRDRKLRPSLAITVVCAMAQQLSGINNAFNFSSTFLSQNGIGAETVSLVAVLMNVGNVFITILSAGLMDRAGRKPLLLASTLAMCAAILALTVALTHPGESWTPPVAVLAVCAFVGAFGVGMGPVPWLLPAELYPSDKVAAGTALAAMCNWLANFGVGILFLPLASALGGFCFLPFLVVLVPFALLVAAKVPETRGKTVQQILAELSPS